GRFVVSRWRLRRTRAYGDSIAGLGCIGNGKVGIRRKSTLPPVTGPSTAALGDPCKRQQRVLLDVEAHFQRACPRAHAMNFRLRVLLRRINDKNQSPFWIHNFFGIKTFDDPHGAVAPWICSTDRLLRGVWAPVPAFDRVEHGRVEAVIPAFGWPT